MDWPNELKTLLDSRKMSQREFAAMIGMSSTFISDVIKGDKPASPMLKLQVLDMRGYDLASEAVLRMLLPKDVAEELVKKEKDRSRAILDAKIAGSPPDEEMGRARA